MLAIKTDNTRNTRAKAASPVDDSDAVVSADEQVMEEPTIDCQRPYGPNDSCDCNPEFAIICSFLKVFGAKIDLELNIEQLKDSIENQETLDDTLVDIHVKLFKKLRRYFVRDQWEKALIRFAHEYSYEDALEIERLGYLKTRPSIKLNLLRRLLDVQFECDQKFKAAVNLEEANDLRTQPVGRDIEGNSYWYCVDNESNFRIYSEEPLDYKSWRLVCKSSRDLHELLEELDKTKDDKIKGERKTEPYNPYPDIYPEYFTEKRNVKKSSEAIKETIPKSTKDRSNRNIPKKSSPLAPLNEVNDIISMSKQQSKFTPEKQVQVATSPQNPKLALSTESNSIDHHVKQTLENLISKVVTTFEFFFRSDSNQNCDIKLESVAGGIKNLGKTDKPKRKSKREKLQLEELPRRSSSRIQQLQQKKITDYLEGTKKEPEQHRNLIRPQIPKHENSSHTSNGHCKSSKQTIKKEKQRWRSKCKKKLSWDKDDSDLSSVSSLTESNDESFLEEINEALNPNSTNEDDEFACEDEENNEEPVIVKRARTARQSLATEQNGNIKTESLIEEDKPCGRCDKSDDADWILLCDMCDDGYHTTCCIPPLMYVPDGDWFCPSCEHKALLAKLKEICTHIDAMLVAKERERQKRQRLRQKAIKYDLPKPSTDEILSEKRNRSDLPDLNEPLAVQALDQLLERESGAELPSSYKELSHKRRKDRPRRRRSKRQRRRQESDSEDELVLDRKVRREKSRRKLSDSGALNYGLDVSSTDNEESIKSSSVDWGQEESSTDEWKSEKSSTEESYEEEKLQTRKARARVSYSFEEYDELIKSAIGAETDNQDTSEGEKDEYVEDEEESARNYGRGKDMATIEALAYQQENGLIEQASSNVNGESHVPHVEQKARKKGRRLNDLDADSEIDIATSDESFQAASDSEVEEDEDETTELDDESDSSIDEIVASFKNRKGRTKRRKHFSETEDDE